MTASRSLRVAIIGCGHTGTGVGVALRASGATVVGVRRTAPSAAIRELPLVIGDCSDPAILSAVDVQLGLPDAVLVCAGPGVRRGRDNRLVEVMENIIRQWPAARLIYTSSTAVYADCDGGDADESAALDPSPPAAALHAIERAALAHPGAVVLRVAALVGPYRDHARLRVIAAAQSGTACTVRGDPDRAFNYLHDDDLIDLCTALIAQSLMATAAVLNACSPQVLSVREYYHLQARAAGVSAPPIISDGQPAPRRVIIAERLHRLLPAKSWRGVLD